MKKILLTMSIMSLVLCSCSDSRSSNSAEITQTATMTPEPTIESETPEPTETPVDVFQQYPVVAVQDIKDGLYTNQYVVLFTIIDNVNDSLSGLTTFDAWYLNGDSYIKKSELIDWDDISNGQLSIANGDTLKVCLKVYEDNSFGFSAAKAIEKVDSEVTLKQAHDAYRKSCEAMSYKEIARYPDKYSGNNYKVTGKILQVVSEDDWEAEYILQDKEGNIIYLNYTLKDGAPRLLEDDSVVVYGTFYKLRSYTSVLNAEKTVPELACEFIDIK